MLAEVRLLMNATPKTDLWRRNAKNEQLALTKNRKNSQLHLTIDIIVFFVFNDYVRNFELLFHEEQCTTSITLNCINSFKLLGSRCVFCFICVVILKCYIKILMDCQ